MDIGYMALWGFGAKSWMDGWVMERTVMATIAHAVLKTPKCTALVGLEAKAEA